ncbi:MAG: RNA polymerase sigma factor [bacterium]
MSVVSTEQAPTTPQNDLELALAAGSGDVRAQQQLADRLFDRVRATVSYLAGFDPDADDLVQLSLVEVLRSAGTFRAEGNLEAWADRITVRTSLRHLKQRRRRGEAVHPSEDAASLERDSDVDGPFGSGSDADSVDGEAERRQLHRRLSLLLGRLKPEWRVVVLLRWVHGYHVEEIAELTEARLNTVRGRLRRGKRQLRKLILGDPVLRGWEPWMES